MFLGIVASAGLLLGGLTTAALLCSNVTVLQTIPFTQKAPGAPSGALEQVLLYRVLEAEHSSSETSALHVTEVAPLTGDMHLTCEQMRQTHSCLFTHFAGN